MSEINNNHINNIPFRKSQVEYDKVSINDAKKSSADNSSESTKAKEEYVPDTGVLGRSQVRGTKGSDIARSVDEAVYLAQHCPDVLECGDIVFDELYEKFRNDGMTPDDAYYAAASGAAEVHAAGVAHKK